MLWIYCSLSDCGLVLQLVDLLYRAYAACCTACCTTDQHIKLIGVCVWYRYTWIRVKDHEQRTAVQTGLPFPSPTLVGCAIAVERSYFMKLGAFDEGMRIWGGENIELGFRTWMCGGQVKTVVCSRVGHVFKVRHNRDLPVLSFAHLFVAETPCSSGVCLKHCRGLGPTLKFIIINLFG